MMKRKLIVVLCCLLAFTNCHSDYALDVGGGCTYFWEASNARSILGPAQMYIPRDVISFDYDDKFIVVKQKPENPQYILDEEEGYDYNRGLNAIYYWLTIKDEQKTLGPMNSVQFDSLVVKYKVPKTLDINRTTH